MVFQVVFQLAIFFLELPIKMIIYLEIIGMLISQIKNFMKVNAKVLKLLENGEKMH
jgi:hypothetical protein